MISLLVSIPTSKYLAAVILIQIFIAVALATYIFKR